jgi:alpha-amylase
MADELQRQFGVRPRGAWLAERVWEPDLPTALIDGGYRWTILDDAHFRAAAIPEEALWGPYTTDDQGKVLTVYGTEQGLRYRIPFSPVASVIDYLRDHATEAGDRVGTMGDDGEKFGSWPTTYEHCWTNGWVEDFFSALEANADWLTTVTPSRWLDDHAPIGRVYVPTGSYAEMGEWALPADEALAFHSELHDAVEHRPPEVRWLRGAIWRNFQVRYREINDLHKQMLRTSGLVEAMPPGPRRDEALDLLLAGQSNDPYWHGLFGGIYLPDLRLANHGNLIGAEDLAIGDGPGESGLFVDLDLDGTPEVLLSNAGEIVSLKPDEGAGIGRWDLRAARFALAAVLRRRPEAYHEKVRRLEARNGAANGADHGGVGIVGAAANGDGEAVASIHDIVLTKQAGLSAHLVYDATERRSGLVRFLDAAATPDEAAVEVDDLGDFAAGRWEVGGVSRDAVTVTRDGFVRVDGLPRPVRAEKTIRIGGDRLAPSLSLDLVATNTGDAPFTARLAVEWSTMLLGGGGNPAAWQESAGERVAHDARLTATGVSSMAAGNDLLGLRIVTAFEPPEDLWTAPIETVSNSEGGFELVYQGSTALIGRVVTLGPGEAATISIEHCASETAGLRLGLASGS